jgi:uncharacterized membrane protein HdeD (DUF308 family)
MFCSKCGKQIEEESKFCPHCGAVVGTGNVQQSHDENPTKKREGVLELVVGAISLITFPFLMFMIINSGFSIEIVWLFAIPLLLAPIVGLATRKNVNKAGPIIAGVLYLIASIFFLVYPILVVLILIFSAVFFYCAFRRGKNKV